MGKHKKGSGSSGLGNALINKKRAQQRNSRQPDSVGTANVGQGKKKLDARDDWIHSASASEATDWARLNLRSITEESNLDEFLRTAEQAQQEYSEEKQNIRIVNSQHIGNLLPSADERLKMRSLENQHKQFLTVPRRPEWDEMTSSEELRQMEQQSFLKWRQQLAMLEEHENLTLTPFEKNLDVWRQLWRVIERSDVVVQIVDARDPFLFYCEDLCKYVKECDESKVNVILVNKADLLTQQQRQEWCQYFNEQGIQAAFWSAVINEAPPVSKEEEEEVEELSDEEETVTESQLVPPPQPASSRCIEDGDVYTVTELITWFKSLSSVKQSQDGVPSQYLTIGMVGYPNVGKSSTINVILGHKKVPVSATPGKTKHFQTLFIDDELCLCDCPGLVMPSFVSSKAEMIVNSILPIDQLRDHAPPITLVCDRIPRHVLEQTYSLRLPAPREGQDVELTKPTHLELCSYYAYSRGFMTSKGVPDCSRAARYILKDYVKGKLLFCCAPPGVEQSTYHKFQEKKPGTASTHEWTYLTKSMKVLTTKDVDEQFFSSMRSEAHTKGHQPLSNSDRYHLKPWKKHHNRNKKEKSRRTYSHLDN